MSFKTACYTKNSTFQDIQVCCRCAFCVCIILPDLGVLKITLLKTILGVWWCSITLAHLKRQGLVCKHCFYWSLKWLHIVISQSQNSVRLDASVQWVTNNTAPICCQHITIIVNWILSLLINLWQIQVQK